MTATAEQIAPHPDEHESLWTADDVARYLRVPRKTVLAWTRSGKLPSLDVFGEMRYEPAAIAAVVRGLVKIEIVDSHLTANDNDRRSYRDPRRAVQLISLKQLCLAVGLHRTTIYRKVRAGTFPRPVRLGGRRLAWRLVDVERWVEERRGCDHDIKYNRKPL